MNARALFPVGKRYRLLRRPTEAIMPSSPRPVRRDCHGRLIAALIDRAGPDSEIVDDRLSPWASATFVGARHEMVLILKGADAITRAIALARSLVEAEFTIPGHLVADLAVDGCDADIPGESRLRLSILTIEAW
ncbi:MAG TPA: hypothetical protein VF475_14485 [Sphingobium sp.]